jgi:hypothetical protein
VRVDGLEEAQGDPDVDGEDVEITREVAIEERASNGACAQDEHLGGMRVLRSETEGCRVLVVNLMDMLVQGTVMKGLVGCPVA